ncbi:MAG: [protein-PII] uridylyltransferase family protein, partial [Acidimicrobiales bacterium]
PAGAPGPGSPPAGPDGGLLPPQAVTERLTAFGFSDAARTARAVQELTRGLTRASRLMAQLLPLLLGWLSESPDPDLGLLGLRTLAAGAHRRHQLVTVCRESAEAARELCLILGTGPMFMRDLQRHPDLIAMLGAGSALRPHPADQLAVRARRSLAWRAGEGSVGEGLRHFVRAERLRIAVDDVLGAPTPERVDHTATALSDLAETVLATALEATAPRIPFAVVAMGRLGGRELSYASDLDVLFVYDGTDSGEGERVATSLSRLVSGETPAARLYRLDTDLRPEGRHGPLARSLDAYAAYYARWAQPWERQALLRGRVVAGDAEVGARFASLAEEFVWGRPLDEADVRALRRTKARMESERAPAGEDPQFHLKLGRGSLSDVEWTVQLLQLRHGVRHASTVAALETLGKNDAIAADDVAALMASYRFCEQTRNRLYLVRDVPGDALPVTGPTLTTLARSLDTTAPGLRDEYRRLTRRARRVMERLFYGRPTA